MFWFTETEPLPVATVPFIFSIAPLVGGKFPILGVCAKHNTFVSTISAVQQISFIAMPLEVFNFICVSPSIFFLGRLLGGRPIFRCKSLDQLSTGCAINSLGTDGLWSIKLQIGDRECSPKSVNPPAARRFSKMGEQNRGQRRTDRNPTLRISPPNGTLLPERTNSALGAGFCQCLNLIF